LDTKVTSTDGLVSVGVVAGNLKGKSGIIEAHSDVLILRIDYKAGAKMSIPVPRDFNALWYNLDGNATINSTEITDKEMLEFNHDGDEIIIESQSEGRAIMLSGKPINEPLATYGPFVMNSQREIMDALEDYQSGKMGRLVEKFD